MNLTTERPRAKPVGFPKYSTLDQMVKASLGGHILGSWTYVKKGWYCKCTRCGMTLWVGESGYACSLLARKCPGVQE